jgi:hypothetical protein
MEKSQKSLYWVHFFLSVAGAVAVYMFVPALTSMTLVPILTFLAKALDLL